MRYPHADNQISHALDRIIKRRSLRDGLLAAWIVAVVWVWAGGVCLATGPTAVASPAAGGILGVARAGGASLYDAAASLIVVLPRAAAVEISGRTADSRWLYVSTRDSQRGWVRAAELVAFGIYTLPVLDGFTEPAPAATAVAGPAQPTPAQPSPQASPATDVAGTLAFQERSGGTIYVYDLARGALRRLTTGADPAISLDGKTVAFWRDGNTHDLYLIDVDGTHERRILARGEPIRAPAWSPDGTKIVFSHVDGERHCRDAGHAVCLPDTYPYNLMFPLASWDHWGLARVDRQGGEFRDLSTISSASSPNWSERGVFYAAAGIQVTQDATGANQNRSVLSEYRYQDPASQPGGERIVFHSLEKDHWEIFAANADGSQVAALTRPTTTLVTPLPHNVAPAWSPDGRHIVFLSNRTGQWKLWLIEADGSRARPLPIDVPITYNYQAEQVVSWGK